MKTDNAVTIRLKDYRQPDYWIRHADLTIRIFDNFTQVESKLKIERNGESSTLPLLVLDGVNQDIKEISLDGQLVEDFDYENEKLSVQPAAASFEFMAVTHISPNTNTSLEGLYKSGTMYCTQCEAEGFRKITFYLDRPDVMATFTTRIEASKTDCPVLLSNGNPIDEGDLDDDRHFATWHDPFLKPAYLFAAVAGDLVRKDDSFTTMSGREVSLRIFAEKQNAHKTTFALEALKRSMKWDEEKYGREYDLDIFMIVASDFFNMGAMENKGLNVFNSAAVLASEETSTDNQFERIEAIVAHEYFHNWSGNRVTCRDWFQLSLKEGFTVFRDSAFTADMHDSTLKRIKDVTLLKNHQFPEDSGPNAHPVQPQEYMEINNFYTVTIYEKGAEVVGMLHTLLGEQTFRAGSDLYFSRFDGMAVTTDDFVACMAEVSGLDLTQFKRWYTQAGTPQVSITEQFDQSNREYSITFEQSCRPTPGQSDKLPFVIPVKMALMDAQGEELAIECDGDFNTDTGVLMLTEQTHKVTFKNISEKPVPSLFRDFSAPVLVSFAMDKADLVAIAQNDANTYNRFDAVQQIMQHDILAIYNGEAGEVSTTVIETISSVLNDNELSNAIKANMLMAPSYQLLMSQIDKVDASKLIAARDTLKQSVADKFKQQWVDLTHQLASVDAYAFNAQESGRRELQALALANWVRTGDEDALQYAEAMYRAAQNHTDRMNALRAVLLSTDDGRKSSLIAHFYRHWQNDTQMLETWFAVQSGSPTVTVDQLRELMKHDAFDIKNPNKVRSIVGAFAMNFEAFHDNEGKGYEFVAEQIVRLNTINPQIAARFVKTLENWRIFHVDRADLIKQALRQILATANLSSDVKEVAKKALGED